MKDIVVSKQMIDEVFDFIEGRRIKKKSKIKTIILRGIRGENFPYNLLRREGEISPLSRYMDGVKQSDISKEFNLPKDNTTYRRLGLRYAKKLELYWNYKYVMSFTTSVLQKKIEDVFPRGGECETVLLSCYALNIVTVEDFINLFVRNEVKIIRTSLLKIRTELFDIVFKAIRNSCYQLLENKN